MSEMEARPVLDVQGWPLVPVMNRERFAELSGFDIGVVNAWIDRGYLPSIKIGRYRCINLVKLIRECSDE